MSPVDEKNQKRQGIELLILMSADMAWKLQIRKTDTISMIE